MTHDIGVSRRGLDKVVIAILDESEILIENTIHISAAFFNVAFDTTSEHEVRVAVLC